MALGKKVKTLYLEYDRAIATGDAEWVNAGDSHTFQDDVRVIGCQVGCIALIPDGAVNADHQVTGIAEVSRHGVAAQNGAIAQAAFSSTWTAAINPSPNSDGIEGPFCFPEGCGIDFDDGEVIYLHAHGINVGTVGITSRNFAIVYYVER